MRTHGQSRTALDGILSCELSESQQGLESWNTEAQGSAALGMLAGDSRMRRLSMCCSEL
jgi:hypothetical protein